MTELGKTIFLVVLACVAIMLFLGINLNESRKTMLKMYCIEHKMQYSNDIDDCVGAK